jgi:hypothetical protein
MGRRLIKLSATHKQQMDGPYELQSDWGGVAFLEESKSQQVDGPHEPQLVWTCVPLRSILEFE